jgi:hypothetical protein
MGVIRVKYFILALSFIGLALGTFGFFHNNVVIFVASQIVTGLSIIFNGIYTFNQQKYSKPILYLVIICISFVLLFDVYRIGKLLMHF